LEVPPLPILGPVLLLEIYENVPLTSVESSPHEFTATFKRLESEGDAVLRLHIQSLLFDLLGTTNHALMHELKLFAMSNDYFADLALIYHMDRFVRHKPPFPFTPITSKKYSRKIIAAERKKWADIWEAYWGALFLERELLGFTTDDLIWIWRRLLCARFKPELARYSLNALTESLNVGTEWNESLVEDGIDVMICPVTSKEGSLDSRLWNGNMEPSTPDEKHIIGYEAIFQTATSKVVKAFDLTEEKARVKVFRNAHLTNNNCITPNFHI
jgi:Ribonuclease III domain